MHVESEMDKAALKDVRLAVRQIFLVGIILPIVHAHPFIHHQRLISLETEIIAKKKKHFSPPTHIHKMGALEKTAVSQLTTSLPILMQLENSNIPQQMYQPDEYNPHPTTAFRLRPSMIFVSSSARYPPQYSILSLLSVFTAINFSAFISICNVLR